MRHLSKKELSEKAVIAFTEYSQDSKSWLLVSPDGAMWASPAINDLIDILNKELSDDITLR